MRELREEEETREGEEGEWKKLSEIMLKAAKKACGLGERSIQNPWTMEHKEET